MRKWKALFAATRSPRRAVASEATGASAPCAVPPGPVIAIGGAEDKFGRRVILRDDLVAIFADRISKVSAQVDFERQKEARS